MKNRSKKRNRLSFAQEAREPDGSIYYTDQFHKYEINTLKNLTTMDQRLNVIKTGASSQIRD